MKNRIHDMRRARGLSQAALATMTGVSRQAINAIENDRHDPSVSLAFAIAAALGVPIAELFITEASA
jgi:putative transcriptional regulator